MVAVAVRAMMGVLGKSCRTRDSFLHEVPLGHHSQMHATAGNEDWNRALLHVFDRWTALPVGPPEVVAPGGDAVRLIHGHQHHVAPAVHVLQQPAEPAHDFNSSLVTCWGQRLAAAKCSPSFVHVHCCSMVSTL